MKEIIIFDDIPENCPECMVNRLGTCTPEGLGSDRIAGRPDWCPRRPVPDAVVEVIREISGRGNNGDKEKGQRNRRQAL